MAICKECLHYEACKYWIDTFKEHIRHDWEYVFADGNCEDFKDKAKYVEQKHGRWEDEGQLMGMSLHRWTCSACMRTKEMFLDAIFAYCPNCGAKMDGE